MDDQCVNCGSPDGKAYDLQLRSDATAKTHLCESCSTEFRNAVEMSDAL